MTKNGTLTTAVAMMCFIGFGAFVSSANAQQGTTPGVALIDLSQVFKSHPGFQAEKDRMEEEVKQKEAFFQNARKGLMQKKEGLKQFRPGSPEYKREEAALAQADAKLAADLQLQKKSFVEQEANIYYRVYREIQQEVRVFAEQRHIGVVLRFNADQLNDAQPPEVMKQLNKAVVYHNPGMNITPEIIRRIAARHQAAPGGVNSANRTGRPPFPSTRNR